MSTEFREFTFKSAGGRLDLHARETGPQDARLALLCVGGLTRNSLDFAALALSTYIKRR